MDLGGVGAYLSTLDGMRCRRARGRPAWYVGGLLVARADAPGTVLVRLGGADRDRLVSAHPETFGVPPRWEAHAKVQADLDGDEEAIRLALRLAWERQRAART
ncbi:hypothetical protein [Terrabacter sp. NPDC080008]|uniref:hypothetical protein n=1 Tax=Terrabacter sp. NPDC080008 TaxID=3155176 RepID=UPI00344BB93F